MLSSLIRSTFVCLFFLHQSKSIAQLPWGDINVIVLTDVHSWVAGQRHLFEHPTDYGNILSFYEQLPHDEHDIFFVMNGDFMDGTGLSTIPPTHLLPILERMPWDAVNMGNHELYHHETVEYMIDSGFIDHWNRTYLTSNVVWATSGEPIGSRFTMLHATHHNGRRILTFGFLYNFQGNCNTTKVLRVQDVVREEWFLSVLLEEDYDAILVLAHMDYEDDLVYVIQNAIREIVEPTMPIQFISGHSHRRGSSQLDNTSAAMEAGHFLDTVGFVSFPLKQTMLSTPNSTSSLFRHKFIDATVPNLTSVLQQKALLPTKAGADLSALIQSTRNSLGLEQPIGCAPQTYRLELPLDDPHSLWRLYMDSIARTELLRRNSSLLYVQGTGMLRYDLFVGPITLDDIIAVTPFNDSIYSVMDNLDGTMLQKILRTIEDFPPIEGTALRPFASTLSSRDVVETKRYHLLSSDFDAPRLCYLISLAFPEIESACRPSLYSGNGFMRSTSTGVMTTDLWITYIKSQWFCEWNQELESSARVLLPLFVVFCIFALLFYYLFAVREGAFAELWEASEIKPSRVGTRKSTTRESFDDDKTPLIRNRHTALTSHESGLSTNLHDNTGHKQASSFISAQQVLASVVENDANLI